MQLVGPERRTVMIRELDVATWQLLRSEAARRRWRTAAVLEHIVAEWLAEQDSKTTSAAG